MRARYDTKLLIAQIERTCRRWHRLVSFLTTLTADLEAVMAALREPWPNGQTEGQINRLKMLKRQMYGAAGIDLLPARLQHPA